MIGLRRDRARLKRAIRRREFEAAFGRVPLDAFASALELGAGDGYQSPLLARYAMRVVSTDMNPERLTGEPHPRVTYEICDAGSLPYAQAAFDLIFSSNLLEHLPDPEAALLEMHRVLADGGIMLHIVPNRLWKLAHLLLFYPNRLLSLAERLLPGPAAPAAGRGNNLSSDAPSFLMRNIWPPVHGEFQGHRAELAGMGRRYWERLFHRAGFRVLGYVSRLPVHSPYRFGLDLPRRLLEALRMSASNGYVLSKEGDEPAIARSLVSTSVGTGSGNEGSPRP